MVIPRQMIIRKGTFINVNRNEVSFERKFGVKKEKSSVLDG
jgi:hypothetical protein